MKEFEFEGVKYAIRKPSVEQQREAQKVYNQAVSEALKSKAILREKLEDLMREQNLWDDQKTAELKNLSEELARHELTLSKGGIKKSDAKNICLQVRRVREQINNLLSKTRELDSLTAQGQADNSKFNYFVSACLVYNDSGKPVYNSLDDYMKNADSKLAYLGAKKFADVFYGLDENYEANSIENKVLRQLGFVNEKLQLIDKEGNLVNEDGKRINEKGFLINEKGEQVDFNGNLIDDNGNFIVESKPFLEDDGSPIKVE